VFGIGMTELMVIFVIGLVVLGPKRLPELARTLGKSLAEFRRASNDLRREFMSATEDADLSAPLLAPRTTPPAEPAPPRRPPRRAPRSPAPPIRRAMDETRLPLTDHLAELRTRIIRILLAWVVGAVGRVELQRRDLPAAARARGARARRGQSLQAIAPAEIFFSYVKCALLAGFLFALPVIFWQIWAFVAPGLYASEKNAIVPFVIDLDGLFVGGAVFGYTQIFRDVRSSSPATTPTG
jgi:Tat protein translocase TatB subunit